MSRQSSSNRWTVAKVVLAAVGVAIALMSFVFGGGYVYNRWYNVPDLTYSVLPTYKLEAVSFAGLVVENRGRATAHEVLINLGDLHTTIQQYDVKCPELWKEQAGGTTSGTLALWLDRMAGGSSLTVYLLTDDEAQLDSLAVTADEGPGHLAAQSPMTQLTLFATLLSALILAAIATLANIGVTSIRTIRARSRASTTFLEYENALITKDSELSRLRRDKERLQREIDDWRSGKRTPPPPTQRIV